ncbi:Glycerol-3-phosphate regulon repressor [Pragia fontium]|uniref:DeoR/GlpR family DNA-binding transcription regulator n=1 Tax=Pragia fontium TaxID=82985 RepID=UPI0006499D88|nr:DeoR/GlpR family DNA-binding transcription regulator [Pragia fontium]AKJ43110.1 DeoR faimly transcriptional regulator [Pragia fontium]SUB83555.1 Glycerol-3-phosphate regulon repressor [Pragia fontium]
MTEGRPSNLRHQAILEQLFSNGQVFVHDLAEQFNVAQETIRRDLTKLESQKLLKKVHGGAVNIQSKFERDFSERAKLAADEKKAIAMKAAEFIKSGDTLLIDFGTTTMEFAQQVKNIDGLTVITNSPLIAGIVQENMTIDAILIGGQFSGSKFACLGAITLKNIGEFSADYAVIGVGAIDANKGIMNQNIDEAAVARKMMENSDKLIVLADSTKSNKHAISLVSGWENVDILVTTSKDIKITEANKKTKIIFADAEDNR